jgi:hypothetical protein
MVEWNRAELNFELVGRAHGAQREGQELLWPASLLAGEELGDRQDVLIQVYPGTGSFVALDPYPQCLPERVGEDHGFRKHFGSV